MSWRVAAAGVVPPLVQMHRRGAHSAAFQWTAALDRSTGIATSTETSVLRGLQNGKNANKMFEQWVKILFGSYPTWLAESSVSFGLLRAVPFYEGNDRKVVVGTSIEDALFRVSLLTFGLPQFSKITRNPSRATTTTAEKLKSDKACNPSTAKITEYRVDIPVIGGVMAYSKKNPNMPRGSLRFSLEKECTPNTTTTQNNTAAHDIRMVTSITNGYHPSISGPAPVGFVRYSTYKSTQSLVHAYVMW
eukprot:CAMPEP_0198291776 /NCGR_PEP_ID=MMETSP1449-20131203/9190_1 /TAXON_ID=420275 /ORGANISM="Attheya septentrionalis, Strain CCMP2084" /LENGTH=246 /DNA_ID=CAMNT_0043990457 /DNA_START=382 /DNA_END=1119 /DNA_ORIENTATION=-